MPQEEQDKLVIFATHGSEDPDSATMPFVMGNAALAMDAEVVVVLNGVAVTLAKKGCYEHIFAAGQDPLKKLVDTFVELGGQIWVCTPCIRERQITEDMLVDGATPVTAGKVVNACFTANAVLNF